MTQTPFYRKICKATIYPQPRHVKTPAHAGAWAAGRHMTNYLTSPPEASFLPGLPGLQYDLDRELQSHSCVMLW